MPIRVSYPQSGQFPRGGEQERSTCGAGMYAHCAAGWVENPKRPRKRPQVSYLQSPVRLLSARLAPHAPSQEICNVLEYCSVFVGRRNIRDDSAAELIYGKWGRSPRQLIQCRMREFQHMECDCVRLQCGYAPV